MHWFQLGNSFFSLAALHILKQNKEIIDAAQHVHQIRNAQIHVFIITIFNMTRLFLVQHRFMP